MDLFAEQRQTNRSQALPLAARMRPRTLDEFVGQQAFLGEGKLLRRMLEADRISSLLFYGPPGSGKTSLANAIAVSTRSHFDRVNAASVGVKELRELLHAAKQRLESKNEHSILFVDELHRFSRNQQDVLLEDVEEGIVRLIGATTENPYFAVNTPLISRSQVFQFQPLSEQEIKDVLDRALRDEERGLGRFSVVLTPDAADHVARMAGGDARCALNALEVAVLSQTVDGVFRKPIVVDLETATESIQRKCLPYDRAGDHHYDTISALIKSIRGSDPDAAVYWLARMLESGEDPRFIARRIVISASEDIGNADPQGLVLAQAAADATHLVGLPECQLPLAQAVIYLATAPKSNACAAAIWSAAEDVRKGQGNPVPNALRSTGYAGAKQLGAGLGYEYPHDTPDGIVPAVDYGVEKVYYAPTDRGAETGIGEFLDAVRKRRAEAPTGEGSSK